MKPDAFATLGAQLQRVGQQSPSEWPTALRHAFTALVATVVCGALLLLADAPGRWQSWQERAQQRQALQDQRAQHTQDLARWRAEASAAVAAPSLTPQVLLQAWTDAAAPTGWTSFAPQILAEADGGWTVQLQLQGNWADGPLWWERWQDRTATATLSQWQIQSLASGDTPGHVPAHASAHASAHAPSQVRLRWSARLAPPADEHAARGGETPTQPGFEVNHDPFDALAWAQHHWQAAQADARVADWLPRWQRAPIALTQARDTEVQYLGRLQSATRQMALVRVSAPAAVKPGDPALPAATVHGVALGDALGPELGQVVQIDDERLVVQRWRRDAGGVWHTHTGVWTRADVTPNSQGRQP